MTPYKLVDKGFLVGNKWDAKMVKTCKLLNFQHCYVLLLLGSALALATSIGGYMHRQLRRKQRAAH